MSGPFRGGAVSGEARVREEMCWPANSLPAPSPPPTSFPLRYPLVLPNRDAYNADANNKYAASILRKCDIDEAPLSERTC
jgi:hypothetical protein